MCYGRVRIGEDFLNGKALMVHCLRLNDCSDLARHITKP